MDRKWIVSLKDVTFFIAFGIYMISCILSASFYYRYISGLKLNILLTLCIILLCFKEALTSKFNLQVILMSAIIGIGIILLLLSDNTMGFNSLLYLLLFVFSARDININKICRYAFRFSLAAFLFIIISSQTGIIENYTTVASKGAVQYLGFRYSLYPASIFSNIVLIRLYSKQDKITWKELIFYEIINIIIYKLTISRLLFIILNIAIVFSGVYKIKIFQIEKRYKMLYPLIFSYLIAMIFSVYIILFYNSGIPWMSFINKLFEGRIALGHTIVLQYGLSALGKNIIWVGNAVDAFGNRNTGTYMYMDNLFVNMILKYGAILTIVFFVILTWVMYKAYKKKDYFLVVILSLLALHGLVDDLVQYLYYNSFLLIASSVVSRSNHDLVNNTEGILLKR